MSANRLILLRHAKSAWGDPDLPDHDRPLNDRGRRSCRVIGQWLAQRGYLPHSVLCSTALRARQTWDGISAELPDPPVADFRGALYHAAPDQIREEIGTASPGTVLVVGHNPGFADLAQALAPVGPAHPKFAQYPTAAAYVVDFPGSDWHESLAGLGEMVDFIVPRDLMD